jgi:hypothetical protein
MKTLILPTSLRDTNDGVLQNILLLHSLPVTSVMASFQGVGKNVDSVFSAPSRFFELVWGRIRMVFDV